MQKAKVIAKQPPMPPADEAAAGSSIGFGRRGDGGNSHAVQGAGRGGGGMTGEIRNPAKLPTDLNPVEKYFARCLAEGRPCKIRDGKLPKKAIESGVGANVIRSEVIRFFAYGGNEDNSVLGSMLSLHGAWISGDLDLMHVSMSYALMFGNCHFADSVVMLHMECAALYLNGSRLVRGLNADGLMTRGDVNLRDDFFAESEVRLLGANIGRNLDCKNGTFNNPGEKALYADGLTTKGGVNLNENFSANGEVRLAGANIGGNLSCRGGTFNNAGGDALYADGLTTKGSVNLNENFSANGEVRLLNANIGGGLECTDGKFDNPGERALSVDGLMTTGGVHLRGSFSAEGEVRLLCANIGGNLSCVGGTFNNAGGDALVADRVTTAGSVYLRDGFSAEGRVRLLGANISGNLECDGGKFHNPKKYALNVSTGNIGSGLLWRKATCEGVVNLVATKADALVDDSDSWESCKVILDGFTYNRFIDPVDAQSRIDWLAKRPDGIGFSPLPYEQAAKVLFGMGHARDAREILLEKERRQTGDKQTPPFQKFWRELWNIFSGYGYRLRYTAAWMAFFVFIGAFIFWFADESGCIVPNRPIVLVNSDYNEAVKDKGRQSKCPATADRPTSVTKRLFPDYPEFNALVYSLDVFIPVFALHQEPNWHPGPCLNRDLSLRFLSWWHWLEIIAGWILTSLLLLSVTGLLRPRQSSGERD